MGMETLSSSNADSALGLAVVSLLVERLRHVRQSRFYLWEWLCYVWKCLLLPEPLAAGMAAARSTMPGTAYVCFERERVSPNFSSMRRLKLSVRLTARPAAVVLVFLHRRRVAALGDGPLPHRLTIQTTRARRHH